jgi:hypothetical protein
MESSIGVLNDSFGYFRKEGPKGQIKLFNAGKKVKNELKT